MKSIKPEIAKGTFALVEPNLHDAWLLGINIGAERSIQLSVKDTSGVNYLISLEGVADFCADDFRAGNIILGVTIIPATSITIDDLHSLAHKGGTIEQTEGHLRGILQKAQRESLTLFEISSSYGYRVTSVCNAIAFESQD